MSESQAANRPLPQRPPRPAASLVVIRDAADGVEVLLLQRTERGDHNSGAWVFPGGVVDKLDRDWHRCTGLDDRTVSTRLELDEGGLDYVVAAIRECFEEAGVLLADETDGPLVSSEAWRALLEWRKPLHRGERTLGEMCSEAKLRLAADRIAYFAHWLTPAGRPKRFDTRFFVAAMPAGQVVAHDETEVVDHCWMRPAEALAQAKTLKLMTPTQAILKTFAAFDSVDAVMRYAQALASIPRICPRLGVGATGARPVLHDEPAYAEIGRLDPEGKGTACYDIRVGVPVQLSPRLIRITAGNGSVMTGPGTNTYLVRGAGNAWAAIDPGPDDAAHVQAILAAAPGPIRWIFVTHTHIDHSPAVVALKAATAAVVHGRIAVYSDRQDPTFAPDRVLDDGDRIVLDPGTTGDSDAPAESRSTTTLRVVHTPGHASNHLCYLLEEERTLFTGDHVMQGSTVVINPRDGDMAAYIESLRSLASGIGVDLEWLAPGHGFLIDKPVTAFERIIRHRLQREAKVVAALECLGSAAGNGEGVAVGVAEDVLLAAVYDDVPLRMHPVARRSLVAHLIKLSDDGAAREVSSGRWMAAGQAPMRLTPSPAEAFRQSGTGVD